MALLYPRCFVGINRQIDVFLNFINCIHLRNIYVSRLNGIYLSRNRDFQICLHICFCVSALFRVWNIGNLTLHIEKWIVTIMWENRIPAIFNSKLGTNIYFISAPKREALLSRFSLRHLVRIHLENFVSLNDLTRNWTQDRIYLKPRTLTIGPHLEVNKILYRVANHENKFVKSFNICILKINRKKMYSFLVGTSFLIIDSLSYALS